MGALPDVANPLLTYSNLAASITGGDTMEQHKVVKRIPTVVIGGGQTGLSVGFHLARRGLPFVILDASARVGDAWRNRWDSLRVFTPVRYTSLPGLPFPARGPQSPTKDEIADYLESYAQHFRLPVRLNSIVQRVSKEEGHFLVETGTERWETDNVIVAMANYQHPRIPEFAAKLDPGTRQLHSHAYRNPAQLQTGDVLVVGAGNSAADIALELAKTHKTWMAGKESGHIPLRIDTFFVRQIFFRLLRFIGHHVVSLRTPIGRKNRPRLLSRSTPLVRVKPWDLLAAGVQRVPRVIGVKNGRPLLQDGRSLDVQTVIWCTGYHPGFSWLDLPVFDPTGQPQHDRGVVANVPGLYFVGLHFLYAMSSATFVGVNRDAIWVVKALAAREQRNSRFPALARAPRAVYS